MIRVLIFLLIIASGILIGPSLMGHDTYVLVAVNGWTMETSLVVMVMMIIVFYAALQIAEWALVNTIAMWGRTRHWFGWRKERIAQQKTIDGVLEFAAGHFSQAEQLSVNHVKYSKEPLLNYFTAINAAATQGKVEQRDEYLTQALEFAPENTALIATKLRYLVEEKDFESAQKWLEQQPDKVAQHDDLLPLNIQVREHFQQWTQVAQLNDILFKHKRLTAPEHQERVRHCYVQQLAALADSDLETINQSYKSIPRKYRNHIDIFCQYAKLVIKFDQAALIEKELFKRLSKELSAGLLGVVEQCPTQLATAWCERLEKLDAYQSDSAFIDVIVRLQIMQRQWKNAKEWLQQAIQIDPSAHRYQQLAQVQQELGESSGALDSFNKALNYRQAK